ncbi:hypothetical protein I552_7516 [Mycobacterium xenopi 3993]|nr:hypothetical protein I552_7516 [Mycobacterium xenopi 3993]
MTPADDPSNRPPSWHSTVRAAMAAWFGSFRYTRPVRHHRTTGSPVRADSVVSQARGIGRLGALVLLLIALIVYGLVELATGGAVVAFHPPPRRQRPPQPRRRRRDHHHNHHRIERTAAPPWAPPNRRSSATARTAATAGAPARADPEAARAVIDPTGADGHNVAAHLGR